MNSRLWAGGSITGNSSRNSLWSRLNRNTPASSICFILGMRTWLARVSSMEPPCKWTRTRKITEFSQGPYLLKSPPSWSRIKYTWGPKTTKTFGELISKKPGSKRTQASSGGWWSWASTRRSGTSSECLSTWSSTKLRTERTQSLFQMRTLKA